MADNLSISNSKRTQRSEAKIFLSKLLIFALLFYSLDFSIGKTLRYFYFKEKSGIHFRLTRALNEVNADLLIFGSSRANHHYVSAIFDKEWGPSFYNVGEDGQGVLFYWAVLRGILHRYSPKVIILDLNYLDLYEGKDGYDRLSALLPHYETHPELREIIDLKSKYEKIKLFSQIYPFNSSILTIWAGNLEMNKARRGDDRGYVPLYKTLNEPLQDEREKNLKLDPIKIKAYEKFITEATQAGARVFVVNSPLYLKLKPNNSCLVVAQSIAAKNKAKYINHINDDLFMRHPEWFSDIVHLNNKGAEEFSKIVIGEIKNSLVGEAGN